MKIYSNSSMSLFIKKAIKERSYSKNGVAEELEKYGLMSKSKFYRYMRGESELTLFEFIAVWSVLNFNQDELCKEFELQLEYIADLKEKYKNSEN
jgi:hypothetical protein